MPQERAHTILQNWLIDLGESVKDKRGKPYYRTYSGDSEPLDVRVGNHRVEYAPDVIWERNVRGGPLWLFEVAFQEDWRAVVGEVTLAALHGRCKGIGILTLDWDQTWKVKPSARDCVEMMNRRLYEDYNTWAGVIHLSSKELKQLSNVKRRVTRELKKWYLV